MWTQKQLEIQKLLETEEGREKLKKEGYQVTNSDESVVDGNSNTEQWARLHIARMEVWYWEYKKDLT